MKTISIIRIGILNNGNPIWLEGEITLEILESIKNMVNIMLEDQIRKEKRG